MGGGVQEDTQPVSPATKNPKPAPKGKETSEKEVPVKKKVLASKNTQQTQDSKDQPEKETSVKQVPGKEKVPTTKKTQQMQEPEGQTEKETSDKKETSVKEVPGKEKVPATKKTQQTQESKGQTEKDTSDKEVAGKNKVGATKKTQQTQESKDQKKPRGRPKGWRKDTDLKKEKSMKQTIITNKCILEPFSTFFHQEAIKKLNPEYVRLLASTPFLHLFTIPKGTHVNNALLHEILLMWDPSKYCFCWKGKEMFFTAEEVAIIMGLPCKKQPVAYKREKVVQSRLKTDYFGQSTRSISRNRLQQEILRALEESKPEKDVVGLLIMLLFTSVLFPQACGSVPVHLFHYADNLDKIAQYSWAEAVHSHLMTHIPYCALWCQMMEKGEYVATQDGSSEDDEDDEDGNKMAKVPSGTLPGCGMAVEVFFLEHSKLPHEIRCTGHILRYLNWHMKFNWRRAKIRPLLKETKIVHKFWEPLTINRAEQIIMDGFIPISFLGAPRDEAALHSIWFPPGMFNLLIEMAPVYWKFGIQPCQLLMDNAPHERFDDINYDPPQLGEGLDDISASLERKFCEAADKVEWNLKMQKGFEKKSSVEVAANTTDNLEQGPSFSLQLTGTPTEMEDKSTQVVNLSDDTEKFIEPTVSADIKVDMPYSDWHYIMLLGKDRKFEDIEFDNDTESWDFSKSIFADPDEGQPIDKPRLPQSKWSYRSRAKLSDAVTNVLDNFVIKFHTKKYGPDDVAYRN